MSSEKKDKLTYVEKTIFVALLGVGLLLAIAGVFGKHGLLTYLELDERYKTMQGDVAKLKEENLKLKTEIEALKNDVDAIERVAREELGMIKPGEVLYRIQKKEEIVETQHATAEAVPKTIQPIKKYQPPVQGAR